MTQANTTVTEDETSTDTDPQTETVTTSEPDETPGTTKTAKAKASAQTAASRDDDAVQKELESLKKALKKANDESKEHRLKAKELDELKAKIEADTLSEKEKLEKKLTDLQRSHDDVVRAHQERVINYEVQLRAAQLGVTDTSDAVKLLDWSEIEYDDSGSPTNVESLLKELLKAKPYLKRESKSPAPTSGGATNPSRSQTTTAPQLSWEIIGKMNQQEYEAHRTEIQAWLANSKNLRRTR